MLSETNRNDLAQNIPAAQLNLLLESTLQNTFKLQSFRPGQREAITTLLEHGRLLCIQPTGHGKSLLYQLPATLLPGITLIVSPLLALMRDQIYQLNTRFNIPAVSINSDQTEQENFQAQQQALQGNIKILFIAPEKLDHIDYFDFLLNLPINFVVVDEAHCISTWGHDFRPSYRQIIHFIHEIEQKNSQVKVLGITATANQKTELDITQQLGEMGQQIIVQRQSMERPNIQLSVFNLSSIGEKLMMLAQLLNQLDGGGLIYCSTRNNTEIVAEYLINNGHSAVAYHAGLEPDKKRELQQDFIANRYKVIAATNALGMGIDKQDLRYIIHFDIPGSITAYYQEVGRCGRDGQLARGILLFNEQDKKIQQHFIDSAQPTLSDFANVLACVTQATTPPDLMTIKRLTGLHPTRVQVVIAELIEQGFLTKKSEQRKQVYHAVAVGKKPDLSRYEAQLQVKNNELTQMLTYGTQTKTCLMEILRRALGDERTQPCGHCSVCKPRDFIIEINNNNVRKTSKWLTGRTNSISIGRMKDVYPGVAILDGTLRTSLFIEFMKQRVNAQYIMPDELKELITKNLDILKQKHLFTGVVVLPSRTWLNREVIAKFIAEYLQVPCFLDLLQWHNMPDARQGELLNNDQRQFNVQENMTITKRPSITDGTLLLLDDYTGSGATLKEAVRALRKIAKFKNKILPFTIAIVKWRLGKSGMV
jgi:ATP-dependent DNA helicase RecQ